MTAIAKDTDVIVGNISANDSSNDYSGDQSATHASPRLPLSKRIKSVIWDTFDKSPEDRKLINKIDWFIMTYVCLAYFVKYLDQTNVSNAYVSGMKEDLNLSGNDLNYLTTWWIVGYIIGQVPSQLIMTKISPHIWLPSLEIVWSLLVMGMAGAKNVKTIYALRFFVGLLEASAYPGIMTLLGNWYLPSELGKRSCIFQASSSAAQMFGGYLQAALYANMNGTHGMAAWRWLFVFDGIIGIPIGLYGYFAIPNSPTTTKARWLKPHEKLRAIERMESIGRKPGKPVTLRSIITVLREWPIYLFTGAFVCHILALRVYSYFNVWLKATGKFTVEEVNVIPTAGYGALIVFTLLFAWLSDGLRTRWPIIIFGILLSLTGTIILSVAMSPDGNLGLLMTAWILCFLETGVSGLYMTWINEVCSYSFEHRAIVVYGDCPKTNQDRSYDNARECAKNCIMGKCSKDGTSDKFICKGCQEFMFKCSCAYTDGTFSEEVVDYPLIPGNCEKLNKTGTSAVHFADITGDGRDDYLYVSPKGKVTMFRNAGGAPDEGANAGKVQWVSVGEIAAGVGGRGDQIRFADLDGDGRAEYIWVKDSGAVQAWWNNGFSSAGVNWGSATGEEIATGIGDGVGVVFADMNGDGRADFIHLAPNGAATLYINQGRLASGGVGWWNWGVIAKGVGSKRENIRIVDLNGDGQAEYVAVDENTGGLNAWYNRGPSSGNWGTVESLVWWNSGSPIASGVSQLSTWSDSSMVRFGDLNGDGRDEYLYIGSEDASVYAFLNGC